MGFIYFHPKTERCAVPRVIRLLSERCEPAEIGIKSATTAKDDVWLRLMSCMEKTLDLLLQGFPVPHFPHFPFLSPSYQHPSLLPQTCSAWGVSLLPYRLTGYVSLSVLFPRVVLTCSCHPIFFFNPPIQIGDPSRNFSHRPSQRYAKAPPPCRNRPKMTSSLPTIMSPAS